MDNEKLIPLLTRLLKLLNVPVTGATIRSELVNHPEINSLATISDALNRWKVPHAAYRVSHEQLPGMPCPFVAQFARERSGFFLTHRFENGTFLVSDEEGRELAYTEQELGRIFSGIVLVCDANEDSGERDFEQKKAAAIFARLRWPAIILLAVLALAASFFDHSYFSGFSLRIATLSATKLLGLVTAIFLFRESIGLHSAFVKKFCAGEQLNCGQVLASKGARFFWNLLTWSDVGLLYFSFTALLLLFNFSSPAILGLLSLFSLLCLPYTVFSIYYQGRVLRKWCLLCCVVQALFWIEAIILLPYFHWPLPLPVPELGRVLLALAPVLALWLLFKPVLVRAAQADGLQKRLNVFLLNEQLFNQVLGLQPHHDMPAPDYSIVLGEPDAGKVITIILSPFCDYCAELYTEIDDWLRTEPEAELRIVFQVGKDRNVQKTEVVKHLIGLQRDHRDLFPQALSDWYESRNYAVWSKQYPLQEPADVDGILSAQADWCEQERITQTPLVLVDGYELPEPYGIENLQTLLT